MNTLLKGCLIVFVLGLIATAIGGYFLYQGAKEVYQEAAAEIEKTYKEEEAKLRSAPLAHYSGMHVLYARTHVLVRYRCLALEH